MQTKTTDKQSLLADAFDILLKNLGPQKTTRLWQILTPSQNNYLQTRTKLFKDKSVSSIYDKAKKLNK